MHWQAVKMYVSDHHTICASRLPAILVDALACTPDESTEV